MDKIDWSGAGGTGPKNGVVSSGLEYHPSTKIAENINLDHDAPGGVA